MITREQAANLRPGDVVEVSNGRWTVGTAIRGPLWAQGDGSLWLGDVLIKVGDGRPSTADLYLTVISRAPRPLYVNHDRTEPRCGDVFRPEFGQWPLWVAGRDRIAEHKAAESCKWIGRSELPRGLRLLVDGETGQVVP